MERCELCPGKNNCVPPSIGLKREYLFIGEAPGRDEDRYKKVFIGKTGRELTEHYLPLAGLRRDDVDICNSILCLPTSSQGRINLDKPKDIELLMSCASTHLLPQIESHPYKLIITMGAFASYALAPDMNLELQHGIPYDTAFGTIFPMFHPASGLHEPKRMLMIRNDWIRLGRYIRGKLHIPKDIWDEPRYELVTGDRLLDWYLDIHQCNDYTFPIAMDTEIDGEGNPYCLTFSTAPGHAGLIMAEDKDALEILQAIIDDMSGPTILFHNWLFDQRVIKAMGLRIPHKRVIDTMVRVFHLGNLPQGLKALSYRLMGMRMQDFDDLVTPYSTPVCLEYLENAAAWNWGKPEPQILIGDDGQEKVYKPQGMNTKLKRFFTDYRKNPAKDIYKAWDNWEESQGPIVEALGRWPGKDIRHVPFELVKYYACRDTDALIRLWPILEHMKRRVRKAPQEMWMEGMI